MPTNVTANQLAGRAIGSLFFIGFGAAWFVLALYLYEMFSARNLGGVFLFAAAQAVVALRLMRRSRKYPRLPEDPKVGRAFGGINAIQWVAIFIIVSILTRLHLDPWSVPAIAGIVGLHLLPLAKLFRNRLHYATGSLLVLWAAGTSVLIKPAHLQAVCSLGTGSILWLSAVATLAIAFSAVRRSPSRGTLQGVRTETA